MIPGGESPTSVLPLTSTIYFELPHSSTCASWVEFPPTVASTLIEGLFVLIAVTWYSMISPFLLVSSIS